jgi:6-phosphogluconolactonase (cycloisomerase 2 family)
VKYPQFALPLMLGVGLGVLSSVAFATTPVVTVTSPTNGAQDGSPVNFTASASSPDCSAGIAAMRIYSAPGNGSYTTDSNSLNVNLSLAPGSYNTVVQAWDNCGGVGKTPVNITVTGSTLPPPRFLYSSDSKDNRIDEYNINPTTGVITPTLQGSVPAGSQPRAIASDQGGFRLYVASSGEVSGYFINRDDGGLQPVPGASGAVTGTPATIVVHPSGDFIYAPVFVSESDNVVYAFAVQANGALVPVPGSPFSTNFPSPYNVAAVTAAAIDPTGNFLYVTAYGTSYVDAYHIDKANGSLTPVPGEPFFLDGDIHQGGANDLAFAQGGQHLVVPGWFDGDVTVFNVNTSTGAITDAPGSPIPLPAGYFGGNIISIAVDPLDRWWYLYQDAGGQFTNAQSADLATLTAKDTAEETGTQCGDIVRADPSGKFVYAIGNTEGSFECPNSSGAILGFSVDQSNGTMTPLPGSPFPSPTADNAISGDGLVVTQ